MKKLLLTIVVAVISLCAATARDVVYLKNGYVERGRITEHVPGEKVVFVTEDNRTLIFTESEIEKIEHEDEIAIREQKQREKEEKERLKKEEKERKMKAIDTRWSAKKGYAGFVDVELGAEPYDGYFAYSISTTHGYQINHHAFIGVGFGYGSNEYYYNLEGGDHYYKYHRESNFDLFATFKGNVGRSRIQFTYGAKVGLTIYSCNLWEEVYNYETRSFYDYESSYIYPGFIAGGYLGARIVASSKIAFNITPYCNFRDRHYGGEWTIGARLGIEF